MEMIARGAYGGHMMRGGFAGFGVLLLIVIIAAIVGTVVRRRRMKACLAGTYTGNHPLPPFMRQEMTREQAARIVVASLKKDGVPQADIRTKLVGEYELEPVIADALLIEVKPKE